MARDQHLYNDNKEKESRASRTRAMYCNETSFFRILVSES